jgi:hypothetical protein
MRKLDDLRISSCNSGRTRASVSMSWHHLSRVFGPPICLNHRIDFDLALENVVAYSISQFCPSSSCNVRLNVSSSISGSSFKPHRITRQDTAAEVNQLAGYLTKPVIHHICEVHSWVLAISLPCIQFAFSVSASMASSLSATFRSRVIGPR